MNRHATFGNKNNWMKNTKLRIPSINDPSGRTNAFIYGNHYLITQFSIFYVHWVKYSTPWNIAQCRSKSRHWSEITLNVDHCRSMLINAQFWPVWFEVTLRKNKDMRMIIKVIIMEGILKVVTILQIVLGSLNLWMNSYQRLIKVEYRFQ